MDTLNRVKNTTKDASALLVNPRFIGPCLAGVFCLIVATVIGVAYLFTMATALLALPVGSYIVGTLMLRGCSATRQARITAEQGERTAAVIKLHSASGMLPAGLVVRDKLPPFIEAESPDGVELPQGREVEARIWLRSRKRGCYLIGPAEVRTLDPLGMLRLKRRVGRKSELIVYPKPVRVRIGRMTRGAYEPGLANAAGRLAPRGDFAGVREYRMGDELRRMHWKTTARTQRLSVIEFEDPALESVTVALDLSPGSDFGRGPVTSLDVSAGVAAYAVREHLKAHRLVRLVLPHGSKVRRMDLASTSDLPAAMAALAEAQADASIPAHELLRSVAQRGSVMLIVTRPGERLSEAVHEVTLRGARVNVVLIAPEPFGVRAGAEAAAAELERAGAEVEIVREVSRL